jgi:hypothetical protein
VRRRFAQRRDIAHQEPKVTVHKGSPIDDGVPRFGLSHLLVHEAMPHVIETPRRNEESLAGGWWVHETGLARKGLCHHSSPTAIRA